MASGLRKRKLITPVVVGISGCVKSSRDGNGDPSKTTATVNSIDETTETSPTAATTEASSNIETKPTASKTDNVRKLPVSFFQKKCPELAQALLGKILARRLDSGEVVRGTIVECEAYVGEHDKAAHSYKLKRTERNEAMFMEPGTVYVYHIYGMYTCINISSLGEGCAVLLRAMDPCDGSVDVMTKLRSSKRKGGAKSMKRKDLCSGPSKLTQAFSIDKATFNRKHICESDLIWLENGKDICEESVVQCARIGVDYAEEWAVKPLRYYILGNENVSVRDKAKEQERNDGTKEGANNSLNKKSKVTSKYFS